jgi:Ca2+-binding RTX toxin-like protein
LNGGAGDDVIIGGAGDDQLIGGSGFDTFVFGKNTGHDTIKDFNVHEDVLAFKAGGLSLADLTFQNQGGDVKIFIPSDAGDTITLQGVSGAHLDASNFDFH